MQEPADRGLWDFALRVYKIRGVAEACLDLQDRRGADVNMLLALLWAGTVQQMALADDAIRALVAAMAPWQEEVVVPLRRVRRRLKQGPPPAPSDDTAALRAGIQAIEIEAERLELAGLEAHLAALRCAGTASPQHDAAALNLAGYLALLEAADRQRDEAALSPILAAGRAVASRASG